MKHLHIIRYVVIHKFTGSQGEAVKQQMENNKNNKPEQKKPIVADPAGLEPQKIERSKPGQIVNVTVNNR